MRIILILSLAINIFATTYNFNENKFIKAAGIELHKSGSISTDANKTVITYDKPQFKRIITDGQTLTMESSSGKVYKLKGKALFYTNQFISIMTQIDEFKELQSNKKFELKKEKNRYTLTFIGKFNDQVTHAIVIVKNKRVLRFKLFMRNGDTLEIVKK
jgi:hypothetical protein